MALILSDQFAVKSMRSGCLSCGNDKPRKLPHGVEKIISTDFDDEFLGVPEFCQSCVEEMGGMVGMVAKHVHEKIKKQLAESKQAAKDLASVLEDSEATIRVLTAELHKAQNAEVSA